MKQKLCRFYVEVIYISITISNLSKSYGSTKVLKDINLNIPEKSIYGIVGKSGVGKSTLLRCINRLEEFNEGSININGLSIESLNYDELRQARKNIGMVFQNFSLVTRATVFENVAMPLVAWKIPKSKINKKVKELLNLVDLTHVQNSKAKNISGGQKQRVAIARALALEPEILLCDEATSALDPNTTKGIIDLLIDVNKQLGVTEVIVTHEMNVIKALCDHICILEDGKVATKGTVQEIFKENPDPLLRLEGKWNLNKMNEIDKSKSLVILTYLEDEKRDQFMTKMALDLSESFSIHKIERETLKDGILINSTIKFDLAKEHKILAYLEKHNIDWRKLY